MTRVIYLNGTSSARKTTIAKAQYGIVHENATYDLEVDTSVLSPTECTKEILSLLI